MVNPLYVFCNQFNENLFHLIFQCSSVQKLWQNYFRHLKSLTKGLIFLHTLDGLFGYVIIKLFLTGNHFQTLFESLWKHLFLNLNLFNSSNMGAGMMFHDL